MPKVTREYLSQNFGLLKTDPQKYLALAEELVRENPDSSGGYFCRYQARNRLGQKELALADIDKVLSLKQHWVHYEARGLALRDLGRYREAIEAHNRAESTNPEEWAGGFGLLFRAECHARLGNLESALADCARLPEKHWTPGLLGAPAGNKAEVAAELRRLAAAARQSSGK